MHRPASLLHIDAWRGRPGLRAPRRLREAALFLLWALALLVLQLQGLGGVPLFDVDEGAFAEATRELLASGDWGHTTLNGADRFDKPILSYWLQALAVTLFGLDEFALRLPSALAAWAWALALALFAWPRWGLAAGLAAGTVLATSLGAGLIGRAATADALLNLWLTLAVLDLWRARHPQLRPQSGTVDIDRTALRRAATDIDRAALRRAALWLALGLLTKGPVALLIPGAVLLLGSAAAAWADTPPDAPLRLRLGVVLAGLRARLQPLLGDGPAWAILLGLALPWYLYALQRHGAAFVDGFFWRHNLQRYGGTLEGHAGAWFYYLAMLPLLLWPWSALLLPLLARMRRLWADALSRELLLWAGFVLVFFSGSGTKLPHYGLYGLAPLALLAGRMLAAPGPAVAGRRLWRGLLAVSLLAAPLLGLALTALAQQRVLAQAGDPALAHHARLLGGAGPGLGLWRLAVLLAALGAMVLRTPREPRRAALPAGFGLRTGLVAAAGLVFTTQALLPWWGTRLQGPLRELAAQTRALRGTLAAGHDADPSLDAAPDAPSPRPAAPGGSASGAPTVTQWGLHQPSFSLYLGAATPRRAPQPGELALVREDRYAALRAGQAGVPDTHWQVLGHRGPWLLVHRAAVDATAVATGP